MNKTFEPRAQDGVGGNPVTTEDVNALAAGGVLAW